MASTLDRDKVRRMIDEYFKTAGHTGWNGEVNERVAAVFGEMLQKTSMCSHALSWVPRPPGGKASIVWLCTQIGSGAFRSIRDNSSVTCMKGIVYGYKRKLDIAEALGTN